MNANYDSMTKAERRAEMRHRANDLNSAIRGKEVIELLDDVKRLEAEVKYLLTVLNRIADETSLCPICSSHTPSHDSDCIARGEIK